eukprot:GEZU01027215.1.p1 GENE.GEZU01027215.1~~GEZU01027215.1.p1  ORF type:complete len:282 (-),score=69.38 GEZU01027215.1:534-1379(-)
MTQLTPEDQKETIERFKSLLKTKHRRQADGGSVPDGAPEDKHTLVLTDAEWSMLLNEQAQYLPRYLRARKWDLKAAYDLLLKTILWRREYKPDQISIEEVKWQTEKGNTYINGFDKNGSPILYLRAGLDTPYEGDKKLKLMVFQTERAASMMRNGVTKMTWIIDLKGYSSKCFDLTLSTNLVRVMQNHNPERLGTMFILNPPAFFNAAWKILKNVIDANTAKKIVFLSQADCADKSKLAAIMSEHIDLSVLEEEYGGESKYKYNHEEYWRKVEEERQQINP